jgi:hypothetical protein
MSTNVKAYHVSASTTLTNAGGRIHGLNFVGHGTGGNLVQVVLREGASATGNIVLKLSAKNNEINDLYIAEHGIRFNSGLYIEMPTSAHATILVG